MLPKRNKQQLMRVFNISKNALMLDDFFKTERKRKTLARKYCNETQIDQTLVQEVKMQGNEQE